MNDEFASVKHGVVRSKSVHDGCEHARRVRVLEARDDSSRLAILNMLLEKPVISNVNLQALACNDALAKANARRIRSKSLPLCPLFSSMCAVKLDIADDSEEEETAGAAAPRMPRRKLMFEGAPHVWY